MQDLTPTASLTDTVSAQAIPLHDTTADDDRVLDVIGDADVVLLGESTHGTHEFYKARAEITKRLILDRGFTAVAVEADWPDAYRVNRYVRGESDDADADAALSGFTRFPSWMWRNAEVADFVGWLRGWNETRTPEARAGFYGLDLYSLFTSIAAVIDYLDKVDPDAAARARERYGCFEAFHGNSEAYAYATATGATESCESDVVAQLVELQRGAASYSSRDEALADDEFFFAEQNARLAINAEEYYRSMFRGRAASWNLRDQHMMETLEALRTHLGSGAARAPKVVVWAHNSHLGDARATDMAAHGELNLGQLVRERFGRRAIAIGFTTNSGTVMAAREWGGPGEIMEVRQALRGSVERIFHQTGVPRFLLALNRGGAAEGLRTPRLQRAIGVIYRPDTERVSHYFHARLAEQFDAVIHLDRTQAVKASIDRVIGLPDYRHR